MVASRNITIEHPFDPVGWPVGAPGAGGAIVERSEYRGERTLRLACTQLAPPYKPADQRRILDEWCQFFREPSPVQELGLFTRTPPELFAAVCEHRPLSRLHVKWGPVVDLTPLLQLQRLEGLFLGTTSVEDISPLGRLKKLTHLYLDNLKRVIDFAEFRKARQLQYLCIEGYPQGPQKIHVKDLDFVRDLENLRALRVGYVILDNGDLSPLRGLRRLEYLDLPPITDEERSRLLAALPKVKFGNVRR